MSKVNYRPMADAKDKPVLAKFRDDLSIEIDGDDVRSHWAGKSAVVVRIEGGFELDTLVQLHVFQDYEFEGWTPLPGDEESQ